MDTTHSPTHPPRRSKSKENEGVYVCLALLFPSLSTSEISNFVFSLCWVLFHFPDGDRLAKLRGNLKRERERPPGPAALLRRDAVSLEGLRRLSKAENKRGSQPERKRVNRAKTGDRDGRRETERKK